MESLDYTSIFILKEGVHLIDGNINLSHVKQCSVSL